MILCLDTSAINALHADLESAPLVTGLLAAGSIRVTATNVVEILKTNSPDLRKALLRFSARLTERKRPISHPNTLLRAGVLAFSKRDSSFNMSVDAEESALWEILVDPEQATDALQAEAWAWCNQREVDLRELSLATREDYRAIFEAPGSRYPNSPEELLRETYARRRDFDRGLGETFQRIAGRPPLAGELDQLCRSLGVWRMYWLANAYLLYARNMRPNKNSLRKNAGVFDLLSACYLSACDHFLTADEGQYEALRFLAPYLEPESCRVELYEDFRRRIVVG